jgi:hypothetical protein
MPALDGIEPLLRSLRPYELDYLQRVVAGKALWMPQSKPQWQAILSPADEVFFGGSAGGGKSDLLIGAALSLHRKAIIFRRDYPQLKDIVARSKEIIGERGAYNGQDRIWRSLPGDGGPPRTLEFGAVHLEDDKNKYKGRAHDLKCFDELPEFSESIYRFLIGWTRSTVPGQRNRVLSAGNPPTNTEGEWVIHYWAPWLNSQHPYPARPGELRWFAVIDKKDVEVESGAPFEHKGDTIKPRSRTFIPARLSDNVFLSGTDYEAVLQSLPEPLRSQLLKGDFQARAEDHPYQVIPTAWVMAAMERGRKTPRPDVKQTTLGVDVARGGADKTVIAPRWGNWFGPLVKYPGAMTPDGPAVATLVMKEHQDDSAINIDVIGLGSSAYDVLRRTAKGVAGINFAERVNSTDKSGRLKLYNVRAESYWKLREALDPSQKGGSEVCLPDDRELLADLCSARYEINVGGIQIEDKEDIRKRIGRSPDSGDAVALAAITRQKYGF